MCGRVRCGGLGGGDANEKLASSRGRENAVVKRRAEKELRAEGEKRRQAGKKAEEKTGDWRLGRQKRGTAASGSLWPVRWNVLLSMNMLLGLREKERRENVSKKRRGEKLVLKAASDDGGNGEENQR